MAPGSSPGKEARKERELSKDADEMGTAGELIDQQRVQANVPDVEGLLPRSTLTYQRGSF